MRSLTNYTGESRKLNVNAGYLSHCNAVNFTAWDTSVLPNGGQEEDTMGHIDLPFQKAPVPASLISLSAM